MLALAVAAGVLVGVKLQPRFSPEAVEVFMKIGRPGKRDGLPEDNKLETIGRFYETIEAALERLAGELGEEALLCGDPERQRDRRRG